eukprot:gnl/MRDRNA2_/MRDRNA2_127555_c0_seq1.p1 gnl/MRDRNA2_/MRDRNA2_127555_c0~~gnl/MRDRNA2_/MRDRNA2_127555_c0_seq1.p1  ORF type:complete len:645 (+),score=166.69 gnl/MRDRNA2_/MRDRNA2_127555_c0_seq1:149-2083(+)
MYSSGQISKIQKKSSNTRTKTSGTWMPKSKSTETAASEPRPALLAPSRKQAQGQWVPKAEKSTTQFFDLAKDDEEMDMIYESQREYDMDDILANAPVQTNDSSTNEESDETCTGSASSCEGDEEATSEGESGSGEDLGDDIVKNDISAAQIQKLQVAELWPRARTNECIEGSQKEQQCQPIQKPKTPLQSVVQKTSLKNGAAAFVPSWGQPALQPQRKMSNGENMLQRILSSAFVAQSWEMHVPSESTSEAAEVDVVLNMPQQMPLQMMQTSLKLLEAALSNEGDTVEIQDIDFDNLHLRFQYSSTPQKQCCWEFSHWGQCPRASCHWPHCTPENISVSMWLNCENQQPLQVGGKVVFKESTTSPSSHLCGQVIQSVPDFGCSPQSNEGFFVAGADSMFCQAQVDLQSTMMDQTATYGAQEWMQSEEEMQAAWMCSGQVDAHEYQDLQQQQQVYNHAVTDMKTSLEVQTGGLWMGQTDKVKTPPQIEESVQAKMKAAYQVDESIKVDDNAIEINTMSTQSTKPSQPATPPGVFTKRAPLPSRPPGVFFTKEDGKKIPALPAKSASEPARLGAEVDPAFTSKQYNFLERLHARGEGKPEPTAVVEKVKIPTKPKMRVEMCLDIPKAWSEASWSDLSEGPDDLALP